MFPHPCGAELAEAVRNGADPVRVVPDEFVVVRGGVRAVPSTGTKFSAAVGPTLEAAASAVPYGSVREANVGVIRRQGGSVEWVPDHSPRGTLNQQHVHVVERGQTTFSSPKPNPVPKRLRIDAGL